MKMRVFWLAILLIAAGSVLNSVSLKHAVNYGMALEGKGNLGENNIAEGYGISAMIGVFFGGILLHESMSSRKEDRPNPDDFPEQ